MAARQVTSEEISEPRLAAAALAMHEAGLSPQRLAQGGDWYIVEWAFQTHLSLGVVRSRALTCGCTAAAC